MRVALGPIRTRFPWVTALLLLACSAMREPPPPGALAPRAAFFGSSTVQGAGAGATERRWTSIVAARLGWSEVNLGLGGSTLVTLPGRPILSAEERWRAELERTKPDVVVIQYGANDVLAGVPVGEPGASATFSHAARELLRGIRATLPSARLIVVEPQPSPGLMARRAPYDAALAAAANEAGALLIRGAAAFAPDAHAIDHVHMDAAGHAAFAEHVLRQLEGNGLEAPLAVSAW